MGIGKPVNEMCAYTGAQKYPVNILYEEMPYWKKIELAGIILSAISHGHLDKMTLTTEEMIQYYEEYKVEEKRGWERQDRERKQKNRERQAERITDNVRNGYAYPCVLHKIKRKRCLFGHPLMRMPNADIMPDCNIAELCSNTFEPPCPYWTNHVKGIACGYATLEEKASFKMIKGKWKMKIRDNADKSEKNNE
jgi:hypothetical protein